MAARHTLAVALTLSIATALSLSTAAWLAEPARANAVSAIALGSLPTVRRNVTWYGTPTDLAPRSLHVESSALGSPSPDEFQISYSDGNFTLVYQREAGGPITSRYTLNVRGLVEWNDTHGDGQLEDGTVVQYTALGPGSFGRYPIQHSEATSPQGVIIHYFVFTSNRAEIVLNLTISDGFVALPSGKTLTPMEAKLTLTIDHNMTLPSSLLAVQMGLSTDQTVTLENRSWDDLNEFSTDDRALNITNGIGPSSSSVFFAWSNVATVNDQNGPVSASGPFQNTTTGDYDFYLSYARPVSGGLRLHVVHDPAMGVVSAAYLSGVIPHPGTPLPFVPDASVYVVSLAAIAALVAGTALLVNRRRRKEP